MNARARILDRIRAAARPGDRAGSVAEWMATPGGGPLPHQATSHGAQRLTQFMQKLDAASATVGRVSSLAELPKALAHELRKRNLPAQVRFGRDPMFEGLDWGTIETSQGPGRIEEPVTLSRAEFGLAETGTLMLASGPENPVTLTFLGETHFVVLREADLCAGFEDFWAAWRGRGLDPRTLNMVTGPSRSADIGQVLQLGAHGPVALHIFMVS
jgi:L-lactate utilization protein LutC